MFSHWACLAPQQSVKMYWNSQLKFILRLKDETRTEEFVGIEYVEKWLSLCIYLLFFYHSIRILRFLLWFLYNSCIILVVSSPVMLCFCACFLYTILWSVYIRCPVLWTQFITETHNFPTFVMLALFCNNWINYNCACTKLWGNKTESRENAQCFHFQMRCFGLLY